MDLSWVKEEVKSAVKKFWLIRNGGQGVLGGKTLHSFLKIIEKVVASSGIEDVRIYSGKNSSQLPGFFPPHKSWDAIVMSKDQLIAAIEFKSQVGSIGNNFNNRTEEVLGSSIDLKEAIEENAFGENANIFTGYIILVEKSESSVRTPDINMKYFPVMEGFLLDESQRNSFYVKQDDGTFPKTKGISYLSRYDLMCKRLMMKGLYKAATLLAIPKDDPEGHYESISAETSITTFLTRLAAHCEVIASINEQKKS
jgi:hypothetical protein